MSGRFSKRKMTGKWEAWFENGQKKYELFYKDNIKDGVAKYWTERGINRLTEGYLNGQFQGPYITYFPDGKVNTSGNYKDGLRDGSWTYYIKGGAKIRQEYYKQGKRNGQWLIWYMNGSPNTEINYKNDKRHGKFTQPDKSANVNYKAIFKNDKLVKEVSKVGKKNQIVKNNINDFYLYC